MNTTDYGKTIACHAMPSVVAALHAFADREGISPSAAAAELLRSALIVRGYLKRAVRKDDGELF